MGQTSLHQVTKIGNIYLYTKSIYIDDQTGKKEVNWEDKTNTTDYVILDGLHPELRTKHLQFRKNQDDHENAKRKAIYDIEHKWDELKRKDVDQWEKENPRPNCTKAGPRRKTEFAPEKP